MIRAIMIIVSTIVIWTLITSIIETHFMEKYNNGNLIFPSDLHRLTNMNWFSCWLIFVFILILNPIFGFYKIVIWIIERIMFWFIRVFKTRKGDITFSWTNEEEE